MLRDKKPLVMDTMTNTWYRSVPGAVGLDFHNNTHGTFTNHMQRRLGQNLRQLTGGDMTKLIVALGWSAASSDGYNLALGVCHAGNTNVYWYRGGREAWEGAEAVVFEIEEPLRIVEWLRPPDWRDGLDAKHSIESSR